jgi:hypothetical protein
VRLQQRGRDPHVEEHPAKRNGQVQNFENAIIRRAQVMRVERDHQEADGLGGHAPQPVNQAVPYGCLKLFMDRRMFVRGLLYQNRVLIFAPG